MTRASIQFSAVMRICDVMYIGVYDQDVKNLIRSYHGLSTLVIPRNSNRYI